MIKQVLYLFALILIAVGIYFGIIFIYERSLSHDYIILNCPSIVNQKTIEEITTFCKQKATLKNYHWHKELKEKFPVIHNIQAKKDHKNVLHILLEPHTCKALLNNQLCASPCGTYYPLEQFEKSFIQYVPHIDVEKLETSPEFKNFLKEITSDILEEYKIIWQSPYKIYFKPKEKKYYILTRTENIPNKSQLKTVQYIAEQQAMKNIILDTRFNNQVIVFLNRGEKDGKGIFR